MKMEVTPTQIIEAIEWNVEPFVVPLTKSFIQLGNEERILSLVFENSNCLEFLAQLLLEHNKVKDLIEILEEIKEMTDE